MHSHTTSSFKRGDQIYYPNFGVGKIIAIPTLEIFDQKIKIYKVSFHRKRVIIQIPVAKAVHNGLILLSEYTNELQLAKCLSDIAKPAVRKAGTWQRRHRRFKELLATGDLRFLTEAIRDLSPLLTDEQTSYNQLKLWREAGESFLEIYCHCLHYSTADGQKKIDHALSKGKKLPLFG